MTRAREMPSVNSTGTVIAMLGRLGLPRLLLGADAPVAGGARGDEKIGGGGGYPGVTTTVDVDDHGRRSLALMLGRCGALPDTATRELLYDVSTTRTWAVLPQPKKFDRSGSDKTVGILSASVARRMFSSRPGSVEEGFWRFMWNRYKRPVSRRANSLLWTIGFRPKPRFKAYLLLLTFGMTSQAATEATKWATLVACFIGSAIPRTKKELLQSVGEGVDIFTWVVVEDGAGWGYTM